MITPLGQRQMFQTINAEAVRSALEVSGLFQRELAQKQALLDRMAEDQASVPQIPRTDGLRTEERKGGRQDQGAPGPGQGEGADQPEAPDPRQILPRPIWISWPERSGMALRWNAPEVFHAALAARLAQRTGAASSWRPRIPSRCSTASAGPR